MRKNDKKLICLTWYAKLLTTPEELNGPLVTGTTLNDDDDITNAGHEIEQKQENTTMNLIWRLRETKL